jgi:hypothetical protein
VWCNKTQDATFFSTSHITKPYLMKTTLQCLHSWWDSGDSPSSKEAKGYPASAAEGICQIQVGIALSSAQEDWWACIRNPMAVALPRVTRRPKPLLRDEYLQWITIHLRPATPPPGVNFSVTYSLDTEPVPICVNRQ